MSEMTLRIPAIHCEACVDSVRKALSAVPTVEVLGADETTKEVRLAFDPSQTSAARITETLDEVGFSPEDQSQEGR